MVELSLPARMRRFYTTKEIGWTFTNRDVAREMGIPATVTALGSIASLNTAFIREGILTAVREGGRPAKGAKYTYTLVKYPEVKDTPPRVQGKREPGIKRHQQDFLASFAPQLSPETLSAQLLALSIRAERLEQSIALSDATIPQLLEELKRRYDKG